MHAQVLQISGLDFVPSARPEGCLDSLLTVGERVCSHLGALAGPCAVTGRVRGTGPGVSFGSLIRQLEESYPKTLQAPFEGVASIAGAVWEGSTAHPARNDAILKLQFKAGTQNLPLHSHDHSDRFIVVLEGRGFFHVATAEDGGTPRVRTTAVRSRDTLAFTRGVMHTFSAPDEDLVLLSYHTPYVALESDGQYTLRSPMWTPGEHLQRGESRIACDPAWTVLLSPAAQGSLV